MSPDQQQHIEGAFQTLVRGNGRSAQHQIPDGPSDTSSYPQSTAAATTLSKITSSDDYGTLGLDTTATSSYPLQLPESSERSRLHRLYFDNFHTEHPFLDEHDVEIRLSNTLDRLGCLDNINTSPIISIDGESSSFMAMVCTTWALAQNTSSPTPGMHSAKAACHLPGHAMYTTSRKVLQAFEGIQPPSLDTVRCYVLNSIYSLHVDMVDIALQSHAVATRLLAIVGPPARKQPGRQERSTGEVRLWWTIFILDRTLSRVAEAPCLLHIHHLPDELHRALETPQWHGRTCDKMPFNMSSPTLQAEQGTASTQNIDNIYLQVVGYVCHLWSNFCDQIHSGQAGDQRCSLRLSALLDTELQVLDAILPAPLRWQTPETPRTGEAGDASYTRRRLSILLVSPCTALYSLGALADSSWRPFANELVYQ